MKKKTIPFSIKHDEFFKKVLALKIPSQQFLNQYLPSNLLKIIDLEQIHVEQESYIEENLKKSASDIVYKVKTKDKRDAFICVILEHQSKSDPQMPLRLWEYTLRLARKQIESSKENKIPLIYPILFYNGKSRYNAPLSLWEMFDDSEMAKQILTNNYHLINLHAMSDDEIKAKKHIALFEYMMKHIHTRDMLNLWKQLLKDLKDHIHYDKKAGFIYMKQMMWYTNSKLEKKYDEDLKYLIEQNLSQKDGEELMPTIAEHYIQEGMEKGILLGEEKGLEKGLEKSALGMLEKKLDPKLISDITNLPLSRIQALKKNLKT